MTATALEKKAAAFFDSARRMLDNFEPIMAQANDWAKVAGDRASAKAMLARVKCAEHDIRAIACAMAAQCPDDPQCAEFVAMAKLHDLQDDAPDVASTRPEEAPTEAQCHVEIDDKRLYFADVLTASRWIDWWENEAQREFDGEFVCLSEQDPVVLRARATGSIDEG